MKTAATPGPTPFSFPAPASSRPCPSAARSFVVATLFSGEIPRSAIYIFDVASSTPLMLLVRNLPLTCVPCCSFTLLLPDPSRPSCSSFLPPLHHPATPSSLSEATSCVSERHGDCRCKEATESRSKYRDIEIVSSDAVADKRENTGSVRRTRTHMSLRLGASLLKGKVTFRSLSLSLRVSIRMIH